MQESMELFFDEFNIDKLLDKLLTNIRQLLNCDAGSIYLKKDDFLVFHIFQNDTLDISVKNKVNKMRLSLNSNDLIAVRCYNTLENITIDNIYDNDEFDFTGTKAIDKHLDYHTNNMMTIPLIDPETSVCIGVLQLINKMNENGDLIPFATTEKDLIETISAFATLSVLKLQNNIFGMHSINKNLLTLNRELNEEIVKYKDGQKVPQDFSHETETIKSALSSMKIQNELQISDNRLFEESMNLILKNIESIDRASK